MNPQMILELVGYFASALVLVSLLMTSVVKLRVINMIGSLIFAVYAVLIGSYPTAVMNFCLVGVNIFFLMRMAKTERVFALLPAAPEDACVKYFLRLFQADIQTYFPGFDRTQLTSGEVFLVYHNASAAGILAGRTVDGGGLEVFLDYATPQYRDCSVGRYLYRQLAQRGYRALAVSSASPAHEAYLKKMGFVQEGGRYVKELTEASGGPKKS